MEISTEEYLKQRNEETELIKDMSIDQIKARILDYESQIWKLKARQQSCFAVIQEDEKKNNLINQLKNAISKDEIVGESTVAKAKKEEDKATSKIDKLIKSWDAMQIPREVQRQMARTIDPNYLFDDEKKVTRNYIECKIHGRIELSKEMYKTQVNDPKGWYCPVCNEGKTEGFVYGVNAVSETKIEKVD